MNRQVNCETANINKTVSAAVKQMEDIRYIQETIGLSGLPANLQEMARVRLERPEATLKELGEALDPPVGKSGVNHRLRKLSLLAQELDGRALKISRLFHESIRMVRSKCAFEVFSHQNGTNAQGAGHLRTQR